jgi:hypothetical protein
MPKGLPGQIALKSLIQQLKEELYPILAIPKIWFNEHEASKYLSFSVHSLRAWRSRESSDGPNYHRVNGRILYHRDDLDLWVKSHKVRGKDNGRT